jgi:aminoglycoside 6-adenylyltransferase
MTSDPVIDRLVAWGHAQDPVRAMLLTSTRAIPGGSVDQLSDYDLILVVRDIRPYHADRRWIDEFGDVLVAWWDPILHDDETGSEHSGNVVQYDGTLKIDFRLWPVAMLEAILRLPKLPAELDAGYRVLLYKDGLADGLRAPAFTAYTPKPPDEATFVDNLEGFFVGVPYVAKCLLRDELLPAKWCLDIDMRDIYLRTMLEWWVGCRYDWHVGLGALGKGMKSHLPPDLWEELEASYAGASIGENWESLFRLIALYRRVARDVAAHLGYAYPDEMDRRVTDHARRMQRGDLGLPIPT